MKKHETMLALAADAAAHSPYRLAHGAVLVHSGTVLASGNNHYGGNRLSPSCPSTHAEMAALCTFFGGTVKQCFEKPAKTLYAFTRLKAEADATSPQRVQHRVSAGQSYVLPQRPPCDRPLLRGFGGRVASVVAGSQLVL
jgi:Cytidine and deoxycytidylate deaminase zinc-binding region